MTMLSLPYLDTPTSTSAAAIFDRNTSRSFDRGVDEREPDAYVCAFPGHYRRPGACIAKSRTPAPAVAQCRRFEVPTALAASSFRNFKSKSGTRIIYLLVPLCFRSSCERVPQCITNFGNGALARLAAGAVEHGVQALANVFLRRIAEIADIPAVAEQPIPSHCDFVQNHTCDLAGVRSQSVEGLDDRLAFRAIPFHDQHGTVCACHERDESGHRQNRRRVDHDEVELRAAAAQQRIQVGPVELSDPVGRFGRGSRPDDMQSALRLFFHRLPERHLSMHD